MNENNYNIKVEPGTIYELLVGKHDLKILTEIALSYSNEYDVSIAKTAMPKKGLLSLLKRPDKCDCWLVSEGGIDLKSAQQIIESFPFDVHPRLDHNAMNLRKFLGLAAAFAKRPDIIVFETSGMDPLGVEQLYSYIKANIKQIFMVEVCWPEYYSEA